MIFPDNDLYIHRGCAGSVFVEHMLRYDANFFWEKQVDRRMGREYR